MPSLQVIRRRIRSVQNTQKITRAMQMVAGVKLRRSQTQLASFRPYAQRLKRMTERFLEAHPGLKHPLIESDIHRSTTHPEFIEGERPRPSTGSGRTATVPVGLIIVSSDTGLCGTYNERVLGLSKGFLLEHPSAVVVAIGKKAGRFLARRGIRREKEILDWGGRYHPDRASPVLDGIEEIYLKGSVSAWWIAYTQFICALSWKPTLERFLPMERPPSLDLPERMLTEPDEARVLQEILRRFVRASFTRILLEAFTAEHSARMIAMKNATDNAAEMIESLTLVRNKVRQAAITKELIEVVSGAEALK